MPDALIGIDPDSKRVTAIVTVKDKPKLRRKVLPTNVPPQRMLDVAWSWVYRLVKEYVDQGYDVHIGIERPFVSPHTIKAAIPLSRLNGVMLAAAQRAGATSVHDIVISSWKKDVIGSGAATKPQIAAWCKVYWKEVHDMATKFTKAEGQQDICDAAAINRHVNHLVKRMKKIEKFYINHPDEVDSKRVRTRKRPVTK